MVQTPRPQEVPELKVEFAEGEVLHNGPLAVRQNYEQYTEENHEVWSLLYKTQRPNLEEIGYSKWLKNIDKIGICPNRIPRLMDTAKQLASLTNWTPVPISGFLKPAEYFAYLANRQFPTVVYVRTKEEFDFMVEPDLFHDAFGHLPMHADPIFADFLQLFGKTALRAENEEQVTQMARLYWFTVEYALIHEGGNLKVCGSGHFSGIKEARFSLSNRCKKQSFDLEKVVKQPFNPHILQEVLFVLDSYEQLFEAMAKKARDFGLEVERGSTS